MNWAFSSDKFGWVALIIAKDTGPVPSTHVFQVTPIYPINLASQALRALGSAVSNTLRPQGPVVTSTYICVLL